MSDTIMMILAVLAIVFGIMIVWGGLKKSNSQASDLQVQEKDGVPILPRSARNLPDNQAADEAVDTPRENMADDKPDDVSADERGAHDALSSLAAAASLHSHSQSQATQPHPAQDSTAQNSQSSDGATNDVAVTAADAQTQAQAAHFEPKPMPEFDAQSPTLDAHFYAQAQADAAYQRNNDPLHNCQQTVTVVVTPRNGFEGVTGERILALVRDYALKYGELNMFHRYERPEGGGMLWFSMLGVSADGVAGFDLLTLPTQRFRGLAFFLSLPHPHALKGFDSMVSVAQAIAKELDAEIHDEQNYLLDAGRLQAMRVSVSAYQG